MLLLTTTSDFLQIITSGSTDVVTSYVDITTSTFTPGSSEMNVSSTTTTIVAAPAASTQRQVKMISATNRTTTAQTVTIQKSSSSTTYNVTGVITLQAGEVLYYQDGIGFSVRDINGQIKQTNIASLVSTYVGYGNSSGVLTGSSNLTYSSTGNLVVGAASSGTTLSVGGLTSTSAIQATGSSGLTGASGAGFEAGYNGTYAFAQGYNRSSSAFIPLDVSGSTLTFNIGTTPALAINSSGYVNISYGLTAYGVPGVYLVNTAGGTPTTTIWNSATSTGSQNYFIVFETDSGATTRGYVFYTASTGLVTYGTSSDERLKKNIADSTSAGQIIDAIKVRQFDWKETDNHLDHWFVAQELYQVAPHAVQPGDDEKPWSVDPSKLVPLLVKEIQDLRARVAALETK